MASSLSIFVSTGARRRGGVRGEGGGGARRSIHRNRGRAAFSRYPFAAIVLAAKIVSFNLPGVAALYKI